MCHGVLSYKGEIMSSEPKRIAPLRGALNPACARVGRQRSRMAVTPMPPAVQTEISPRFALFSSRILASVATMRRAGRRERVPDGQTAAFHIELGSIDGAERRRKPSFSRQNVGSFQAFRVQST